MSILALVEMEDGIDHWLNRSLRQQWYNFFCECGCDCDLLLQRSRAKHSTGDMEAFAQDLIEVDISLTAGNATDEDDPAPERHSFEAGGEIRTSIQIKNDVKAVTVGDVVRKAKKLRQNARLRDCKSRLQTKRFRALYLVRRTRSPLCQR